MYEKFTKLVDYLRDFGVELLFGSIFMLIRGLQGRLRKSLYRTQCLGQMQTVVKEDTMDKVIPISSEISANIVIAGGKLKLSVEGDVDALLDKLALAIPGKIDDAIIQVLKAALKVV